ncbi:MAG TPA: hypothetical protein VI757_16365 [Bacteroidia bacterium]|nr:hypothetical protein [Bacteroidia bacterium]
MLSEKPLRIRQSISFIVVLLAGACLFFLNRKSTIDWSEDNAAFILQAKATASGHLQSEYKFVYDDNCIETGPAIYPWGFPLVLSAVYPFAGKDIYSYIILMHVILVLVLLLLCFYMRKFFAPAVAALLVLVFAFNPETVIEKNDIMSDLFCLFLILIFLYMYENIHSRKITLWLSAFLLMLIVNTRVLGFCLVPAIFLYEMFADSANRRQRLLRSTLLVFLAMIFSIGFSFFISGSSVYRYVGYFIQYIKFEWSMLDVISNGVGYLVYALDYFIPKHETWQWAIIPIRIFTLLSVLTGVWQHITLRKYNVYSFFIPVYLIVIIIFPFHYIVERYFFPVAPFMLLMMLTGWEYVLQKLRLNKNICIAFLCVALAGYYPNLKYLAYHKAEPDGPQTIEATEAWHAVNQFTNETDTVCTHYPRALIFFTNRFGRTLCNNEAFTPTYILNDNSNRKVYDQMETTRYSLLWKNERFELYKLMMRN